MEECSSGDEILSLGENEDFYNITPVDYVSVWKDKRIKKKIYGRILSTHNNPIIQKLFLTDKNELRQTKFLPQSYSSKGCCFIFGNNVVNWNTALPKAILIEDKVIADFYRGIFEVLWESL